MSINNNNIVLQSLFNRRVVALLCWFGMTLFLPYQASAAGTMEYYHYDSQGSLLDVYQGTNRHILSQSWNAWGQREVLWPPSIQNSFLPTKNIPVYLGYKGAKPVADDSLILFGGKKVYSPQLYRLVNPDDTTTAGDNHFSYADNNPLNEGYQGPGILKKRPGWRNLAYALEMAAAGALTVGICYSQPEFCSTVVAAEEDIFGDIITPASAGIALGETTNIYAAMLATTGAFVGVPSCAVAYGRQSSIAKGLCTGSLSAVHTAARIALSYKFSGKLGSGELTWGRPTANQIAYSMSFTAINGTSSIASMALGDSWTDFSSRQKARAVGLAIGISWAQSIGDMYFMRWLEGFSAFKRETEVEMEWFDLWDENPISTIVVPNKYASRIGEVVFTIYAMDLASATNKRQRLLTRKEIGCQMLDTTIYQGTRVGVANAFDGATFGRVPAAGGSGLLAFMSKCTGEYDSFF